MEIVIVGGGELGRELSRDLNDEGHEITLIDNRPEIIDQLIEEVDIKGVVGSGTSIDIQREADVDRCRVFIAVTQSDEINLISSNIAKVLGAEYCIVRARKEDYALQEPFMKKTFGLNTLINQDRETAQHITNVVDFPAANYVEMFNHKKIHLVRIKAASFAEIVGMTMQQIRQQVPNVVVCVLTRAYETIIPRGDTVVLAEDELDVIASDRSLDQFAKLAGHNNELRFKSALIVGGSRVANYLLPAFHARGIRTKVIEQNEERAIALASRFNSVEVILGDGTDQDFLREHRIGNHDLVITLTDNDEENLMVSLFAYHEGVRKNVTKINQPQLTELIDLDHLDALISPRLTISDSIIRRVRTLSTNNRNHLVNYARLNSDQTEALEFVVVASDEVTRAPIKDLPIKDGVVIGAIIRDGEMIFPTGDDYFVAEDHVLIISVGEKMLTLDHILKKHGPSFYQRLLNWGREQE